MDENKPQFTVSIFLPALIFGPPIQPISNIKKINYSTDVFYSLFNGSYEVTPPTSFGSYVCFLPYSSRIEAMRTTNTSHRSTSATSPTPTSSP
jgi:hypothetical protein